MTTILSHAVVLSVIQMFLFLVTPVAFGQDVSCYRTLDTLRVERDARVARCGDGRAASRTPKPSTGTRSKRSRAALRPWPRGRGTSSSASPFRREKASSTRASTSAR
jgi:hypothetical protein